jgi:hypothetical protein
MPLTPALKDEAKKLVDRAGHGDQNALAMIEQIGVNARGGQTLAQESHAVILDYIASKPKPEEPLSDETVHSLGALRDPALDPVTLLRILCSLPKEAHKGSLEAACVILAQGAMWTPDRIGTINQCVIPPCRPVFQQGLENAGDTDAIGKLAKPLDVTSRGVLVAGNCLGVARRLQGVQQGVPLSFLSAEMGWELE